VKDLEVVRIDRDVQAAAPHAQGVLEGQPRGGFGEGADRVVGAREVVVLVGRERLAEVLGDEACIADFLAEPRRGCVAQRMRGNVLLDPGALGGAADDVGEDRLL